MEDHHLDVNPLSSMLQFLRYVFYGRIHFPDDHVNEIITFDDGLDWQIFRQVVIDPALYQPQKPGAVFRPRFHIRNMYFKLNQLFSLLPIPFFVGRRGFRSKLWLNNAATGDSQGYYEWDAIQDAKNYKNSFAARFMERRSTPGSVSFTITRTEAPMG